MVDENLRHAFPELSAADRWRLARRMWEHLFLLVLEVAHAPRKIHDTNWRKFVVLRDVVPLMRQFSSGRPAMVVTGHFGNFELGGFALGILGFPTYSVARPLDNVYIDRFLARFRGATGQHIIPKNGGYEQILAVLARGGTMAFLADQYAGEKGCWVEFFGRPASAYKGIALMALEHDAPMAVCSCRRLGRPLRFEMVDHAMVRSPLRRRRRGHGPRVDAVVHQQVGRGHSAPAGPVLVAAPPLEGPEERRGTAGVRALILVPSAARCRGRRSENPACGTGPGRRRCAASPGPRPWRALAGELAEGLAQEEHGQAAAAERLLDPRRRSGPRSDCGRWPAPGPCRGRRRVATAAPPLRGTSSKRVRSNTPSVQASHQVRVGGSTTTSTTICRRTCICRRSTVASNVLRSRWSRCVRSISR